MYLRLSLSVTLTLFILCWRMFHTHALPLSLSLLYPQIRRGPVLRVALIYTYTRAQQLATEVWTFRR